MSKSRLFLANSAFAVRNEPRKGRKLSEKAGQCIDNLTAIGENTRLSQGGSTQRRQAPALSRQVAAVPGAGVNSRSDQSHPHRCGVPPAARPG